MIPLHIGQIIKGTVEKLVYGGSGLIRYQGIVIFVPHVIPNEQVTIEVTQVKARYAEGIVVSVETPSEHRITPLCPYYGRCGGCQLQHIDPLLHPSLKQEWLKAALYKDIPEGLNIEIVPAQQVFAWRRKITLHGRWKEQAWVFGFFGTDNVSLIPISCCPLFFTAGERTYLQQVTAIISKIPGTSSATLDLTFFRLPQNDVSILLSGSVHLSKESVHKITHELCSLPFVRTVSFRLPRQRHDSGNTEFAFEAFHTTWHCSVDAFIQNHKALSEVLWADIIDIVDSSGREQTIFDLYSGIGITAIGLAQRGHFVTAVELSEAAVRAARMSAEKILKKGHLTLLQSSVEKFLSTVKAPCDWMIVNPPRSGLSPKVTSRMLEIGPKRILYVSCSPPTMARDLALLRAAHWHVQKLKAYDMFPQTTHFETVAVISR